MKKNRKLNEYSERWNGYNVPRGTFAHKTRCVNYDCITCSCPPNRNSPVFLYFDSEPCFCDFDTPVAYFRAYADMLYSKVSSFHFPLNTIRVLIVDDKGDICQEYKLLDFFKLVKLI